MGNSHPTRADRRAGRAGRRAWRAAGLPPSVEGGPRAPDSGLPIPSWCDGSAHRRSWCERSVTHGPSSCVVWSWQDRNERDGPGATTTRRVATECDGSDRGGEHGAFGSFVAGKAPCSAAPATPRTGTRPPPTAPRGPGGRRPSSGGDARRFHRRRAPAGPGSCVADARQSAQAGPPRRTAWPGSTFFALRPLDAQC